MYVRVYFPEDLSTGHTAWGWGTYREPPWHHDYPFAETNLMNLVGDVTYARVLRGGNVIAASDPMLHRFPVAYVSEPGYWTPDSASVMNVRSYLRRGGFLVFDDFGLIDLPHALDDMRRIVPELRPIDLDGSEAIFHVFFDIPPDSLRLHGYRTRRGEPEHYIGYFEGNDKHARMVAILFANNDVGEFMEYNQVGIWPVDMTNAAFKIAVNYMIYPLTH